MDMYGECSLPDWDNKRRNLLTVPIYIVTLSLDRSVEGLSAMGDGRVRLLLDMPHHFEFVVGKKPTQWIKPSRHFM